MARTHGSRADITGPLIREQALILFARDGYAAVSMRKIAASVGVQVGTLYGYTPDKQALLFDLLHDHMQDIMAEWVDDPQSDPMARLAHFTRIHLEASLARRDAVFLSYMELRNLTAENYGRIATLRRCYEDRLESLLQDGIAVGVMQIEDTRVTAMALISMLTGVTNWYRDGGRLGHEDIHQLYWSMIRKAVTK